MIDKGSILLLIAAIAIFVGGCAYIVLHITHFLQKARYVKEYIADTVKEVTDTIPLPKIKEEVPVRKSTREYTLEAIKGLDTVPIPVSNGMQIPLLYDGKVWYNLNLSSDGHWGIFGTTGSGKGNILQWIALEALKLGSEYVTLTVLDGKGGLDYSFCEDVDHAQLFHNGQLTAGCKVVIDEMNRRNKLLLDARVRNREEYILKTGLSLPLQIVIADEFVNFTDKDRLQIVNFACISRAMGGVLFVATQQPTVDVLPTQIQANLNNRCVFRLVAGHYTAVALRRTKADDGMYEPSVIPKDKPGIAVLRTDSVEISGRAFELTDQRRNTLIQELVTLYPKEKQIEILRNKPGRKKGNSSNGSG